MDTPGSALPVKALFGSGRFLLIHIDQPAILVGHLVPFEGIGIILIPPAAVEHINNLAPVGFAAGFLPPFGIEYALGQVGLVIEEKVHLFIIGVGNRFPVRSHIGHHS